MRRLSRTMMADPRARYTTATTTRSMPWLLDGMRAPSRNWAQKRPKRAPASRAEMARLARMATAKNDWAPVRRSSSLWAASMGRPWWLADVMAKTTGRVPTSSVHWLTLADTRVARPALLFNRHA